MDFLFQNLLWLKILSGTISAILIIRIIYIIIKIDYFSDNRDYGWRLMRTAREQKDRTLKEWDYVMKLITLPDPSKWKNAINLADDLLFDIFKASGYRGFDMDEVLAQIDTSKISNINELRRTRLDVVYLAKDKVASIDREKVKDFLREYRQALRQMGLVE